MPFGRTCMVINCKKDEKFLNLWRRQHCHEHNQLHELCPCKAPFVIHPFPRRIKDREIWVQLVNRCTLKGQNLLRPRQYHGVCSHHFVDGAPSAANPNPTKDLGYDKTGFTAWDLVFDRTKAPPQPARPPALVSILKPLPSSSSTGLQGQRAPKKTPATASPLGSRSLRRLIPIPIPTSPLPASPSPGQSQSAVGDKPFVFPDPEPVQEMTAEASRLFSAPKVRRLIALDSGETSSDGKSAIRLTTKRHLTTPTTQVAKKRKAIESPTSSPSLIPLQMSSDFDVSSPRPKRTCSTAASDTSSTLSPMTPAGSKNLNTVEEYKNEIVRLHEKYGNLVAKYKNLTYRFKRKRKVHPAEMIEKSDHNTKFYTGFPNFATLKGYFDIIHPQAKRLRLWTYKSNLERNKKRRYTRTPKKTGADRKLSLWDEYLLTLMRLRLGLLEEDLAHRFSVSQQYVSQVLLTWIKFLAQELRCTVFVPSKEQVQETLPKAFKSTPNVKHIIDGTEIFCQSTGDLELQVLLWSNYKHHHTAKFLIGVCPNGHFSFVSEAYGGHITDKQIVNESGFLDVVEPYDEVMADRGFPISEDLNRRLCTLHIPRGRRGVDQFSREDIQQIKKVANTRIHVERAIRRLKVFRILKGEQDFSILPQLSDIMVIVAAICNTLPPLVAD